MAVPKSLKPTGWIMNSWKSTLLSACLPPFRMLSIGAGRRRAPAPPRYRQSGMRLAAAAACAVAMLTPSRALAPILPLLCVPSNSIIEWSSAAWSRASMPRTIGAMRVLTLDTALATPLPSHCFLSPSRSSTASCSPVDAPLGTMARPKAPPSRATSHSSVGLPRESMT